MGKRRIMETAHGTLSTLDIYMETQMKGTTNSKSNTVCYELLKRVLDLTGATFGIVLTAPLMTAASIAIRATMGSPVLFRQQRPGLNGKPFELLKFRTMRPPEPGEQGEVAEASRLTTTGRILRATSIDELPTFINVIKGDMSLVGPRPLLMRYLSRYSAYQSRRHEVKPGVTGWTQINGRNALSWDDKFNLDVWYVENRSLLLDIRILLVTVYKVLKREGISNPHSATMTEFTGNEPSLPSLRK